MSVPIRRLDIEVQLSAAETIHTESSHKFDASDIATLAAASGFRVERTWTDTNARFAVTLLVIV
jgi:L-histidine N-alpha-methyltransferase